MADEPAGPAPGALTHLDAEGRARMVDVSGKASTRRVAEAEGRLRMSAEARALALSGRGRKGDVFAVAELAGVMAAKRTGALIPLCHPVALSKVAVTVATTDDGLGAHAQAVATGPTGVEMEALTAVAVALLTLYDMLKAADRGMAIDGVRLLAKSGGRSGDYAAPQAAAGPGGVDA